MSGFLERAGRITEWVVISNLENRAVNAACDKAQGWWHDRKQKKHGDRAASAGAPPPPPPPAPPMAQPQDKSVASYSPQQQPHASYMAPPPPSTGSGQLSITVSNIDGLNQFGPLIVVMECNQQRYQVRMGQPQPCSFPVYQFDYDQVSFWIQTEYQQQTVAHGEIPVRILLNGNNSFTPSQPRWIPLRDYYNAPIGQLLVNFEYSVPYAGVAAAGPSPPPPYGYYS